MGMAASPSCIFCQIACSSTMTTLLHSDEKVVAFQDIYPSALRHYLVIPVEHIATVKNLQRRTQDYSLVNHMLNVGQALLRRDAPNSIQHRFGFHQPPFNSVNHLHLHCLALPYVPRQKERELVVSFSAFEASRAISEASNSLNLVNGILIDMDEKDECSLQARKALI